MCAVAGTAMLTACVDHDYDLSKDIDLTVTLGGNELTLPTSSTDVYTMAQILDLDPENSSIKPVETQGQYGLNKGDYVLTQTGDPSESTVSIDAVNLSDITGSTVKTMLDPFVVVAIAVNTGNIVTTTSISDKNVTPDIRTLTWIGTDCEMILSVHYNSDDFNGNAIIKKGTVIKFDESWKVEIADDATRSFAHMANDHTLEFTNDCFQFGQKSSDKAQCAGIRPCQSPCRTGIDLLSGCSRTFPFGFRHCVQRPDSHSDEAYHIRGSQP